MPPPKSPSRPFTPDDRQRQAIEHVHGPLLVIAGAGTGKTSVLTNRIAHLVHQGHAKPEEILALTYTKNAAAEMRERVTKLLGGKQIEAATFHDYCLNLLKRAGKDFGVLDDKDLWIYLRRRIRDLQLEHFVRAANISQFLSDLLDFISRCHDELIPPEKYAQYVARLERGEVPIQRVSKSKDKDVLDDSQILGRCREIARVFATVERWLEEKNLGTFSHMITRAHTLLHHDENVLAASRARARFILVDEFQDANFAQVKILAQLAGPDANIFAVGDPDQAIYRFRGASSAAFEIYRRHFPGANLVVLEKNRRSTTPILRSAFALIDKNPPVFNAHTSYENSTGSLAYHRTPLQSAREEEAINEGRHLPSPQVCVTVLAKKETEGPDLIAFIQDQKKKLKARWSDFGILYRQHSHRDDAVRELGEAGIPFLIENMDVSDTPEARDLLACLLAVITPSDDVSLFRVAALPCFTIAPEQLRSVTRAIAKDSREGRIVSLASALDRIDGGAAVLAAVQNAREEIHRRGLKGRNAVELLVKNFKLDRASPIVQAVLKFVSDWEQKVINETTTLEEFVDYLTYFREANGTIPLQSDDSKDAVRLMTVHLAKGLEFPHVLILRANSGSFPNYYRETLVEFPAELRDPDSAAEGDDRTLYPQEERRLFYVAMTRARDSLTIYSREGKGAKNKNPDGLMRELIENRSLAPWFRWCPAAGAQASLDLAAAAEPMHTTESRTTEWLNLPVLEGLHTRLSASAVDTYERCGLQFRLERDWRLSGKPGAALQYGAAIHRVLRTYFDSKRAGRPKTEEELVQLFCTDLRSLNIQEQYQHELYEQQGIEQLRKLYALAQSIPADQVLHTEESFDIRIGATLVTGRIDRIDSRPDGSIAILDYKTGKARDQKSADESLQLSLYAIAAREKWNYNVGSLIFYNLADNLPVISTRTDAQLTAARNQVEDAAAAIAQGNFDPNPGMHCSFCSFRILCPAKEKRIPNLAPVAASDS